MFSEISIHGWVALPNNHLLPIFFKWTSTETSRSVRKEPIKNIFTSHDKRQA